LLQKVYLITGGKIKPANKAYNSTHHEYEIIFDKTTEISETNDNHNIKPVAFKFIKINQITNLSKGTTIDILAVVVDVSECQEILVKKTVKKPQSIP
jgi:replication factor A1